MAETLVPQATQVAAKRGFIRTSSQSLATSIPTSGITGAALSNGDPTVIAWSVGAAVLSSLAAGAVSYFSILSNGIPDDYAAAVAADEGVPGRHAA